MAGGGLLLCLQPVAVVGARGSLHAKPPGRSPRWVGCVALSSLQGRLSESTRGEESERPVRSWVPRKRLSLALVACPLLHRQQGPQVSWSPSGCGLPGEPDSGSPQAEKTGAVQVGLCCGASAPSNARARGRRIEEQDPGAFLLEADSPSASTGQQGPGHMPTWSLPTRHAGPRRPSFPERCAVCVAAAPEMRPQSVVLLGTGPQKWPVWQEWCVSVASGHSQRGGSRASVNPQWLLCPRVCCSKAGGWGWEVQTLSASSPEAFPCPENWCLGHFGIGCDVFNIPVSDHVVGV